MGPGDPAISKNAGSQGYKAWDLSRLDTETNVVSTYRCPAGVSGKSRYTGESRPRESTGPEAYGLCTGYPVASRSGFICFCRTTRVIARLSASAHNPHRRRSRAAQRQRHGRAAGSAGHCLAVGTGCFKDDQTLRPKTSRRDAPRPSLALRPTRCGTSMRPPTARWS
jgi:hypothetical protein